MSFTSGRLRFAIILMVIVRSLPDGAPDSSGEAEFGFRTFVDVAAVPEPSALLCGSIAGLVGLGASVLRRKALAGE